MKSLLVAPLLALAPLPALAQPPCKGTLVYFGSFAPPTEASPGIVGARLDERTGKLCTLGRVADIEQPTWLAIDAAKPVLYATRQVAGPTDPAAFAYAINPRTGALTPINSAPTGGAEPTHLSVDASSRTLFAAHWGTGHVSALPLRADGGVEAPVSIEVAGGGPPRPRAHAVTRDPAGDFVVAAEYGLSRLLVYRFDAAGRRLSPADGVQLPAGSGPRHFVFGPGGKRLYLLSENSAEVRAFDWDPATGALVLRQTLATSAPGYEGRKRSAAIVMSKDGRYLYVSNRSEDVIVGYAVDPATGLLTERQRIAAGGKDPRDFALSPNGRWVLVANQASDAIDVFARDPKTGALSKTETTLRTSQPVTVTFFRR